MPWVPGDPRLESEGRKVLETMAVDNDPVATVAELVDKFPDENETVELGGAS